VLQVGRSGDHGSRSWSGSSGGRVGLGSDGSSVGIVARSRAARPRRLSRSASRRGGGVGAGGPASAYPS
jgi:hypothetical protein